jgi:hypothetical protein
MLVNPRLYKSLPPSQKKHITYKKTLRENDNYLSIIKQTFNKGGDKTGGIFT